MLSLKEKLIQIAGNDYVLPENVDPYVLTLEMMEHIGSIDSELRDDLIYTTLATWILKKQKLKQFY